MLLTSAFRTSSSGRPLEAIRASATAMVITVSSVKRDLLLNRGNSVVLMLLNS